MRIAYLTNQYPKVSHSFIRREIAALEADGVEVERFTLRHVDEPLLDPDDLRERTRTTAIVDAGKETLASSMIRRAARDPRAFARALRAAAELGQKSERGVAKNLGYLAAACVLADALEIRRVRHVHAHFGTNPAAVALLCHLLSGVSYSFTVHGPEEFDQTYSLGLATKIEHAAFVAAVSSYGQSQLRRLVPPSQWDKIAIVRCGVDASYLTSEPTPVPDTNKLVSVARLSAQKGQITLIEAAAVAISRGTPLELVLVGDGEMRDEVETCARDLGIAPHVHVTGWASGEEVQRHLREARAFVLPSYAEGLPVVMMEAFALGRPIIATYVAGIPELVANGKNGWLVPAGSVDALADAIGACLVTPPIELMRRGLEGRDRVLAMHDVEKNAVGLARLFRSAIG